MRVALIVKDSVVFVDPDKYLDIAQNIKKLVVGKQLSANLVKKGLENAKRFTWDKTVTETLSVYKTIIKN